MSKAFHKIKRKKVAINLIDINIHYYMESVGYGKSNNDNFI